MNPARKRNQGGTIPLFLVLAFAVGGLQSRASADAPHESTVAPDRVVLERAAESRPSTAGVHGTITVDFEKVTIAELMRLVNAVERVDGVIHIVSSSDRNGETAMVVGRRQGVLSIAPPDAPADSRLTLAASQKPMPPLPLRSPPKVASIGRTAPEFPRLAALGRWLGVVRAPLLSEALETAKKGTASPVMAREASLGQSSTETVKPDTGQIGQPSFSLTAGNAMESLANGGLMPSGPVRSPWPAATPPGDHQARRDQLLARADHVGPPQVEPREEQHVAAPGDTFEALARRFYGDSRYAWALWWSNRDRIAWPDALTPGKPIAIPALGRLDPKMVMADSPEPAGASPKPRRAVPRRDPALTRASLITADKEPMAGPGGFAVHVVRPEDTLRMIARERCGDERKALEIIALNRDVLTPEGRPRVGQRLVLPITGSPAP